LSSATHLPKIAVISFPGTNTERETLMAIRRAGMEPAELLWNAPDEEISSFDGYVIAGGFSYEDRSRAGVIASLDPIMKTIARESDTGKPVLGICNGAQVLVESGLVPGLDNDRVGIALTNNKRTSKGHILGTGYFNDWSNLLLSAPPEASAFTGKLKPDTSLCIPFAHAEGRFIFPEGLLEILIQNDQIPFRYCSKDKEVIDSFPVNPNGSVYNTAAVTNISGNIMAIMPHPERTVAGDILFESMRDFILAKKQHIKETVPFLPPKRALLPYKKGPGSIELIIKMIITDNTAISVHNALKHLDIPITVSRYIHYEIDADIEDQEAFLDEIARTDVLFNSNKEHPVTLDMNKAEKHFLIHPREDLIGRQKLETLTQRFGFKNINNISRGVLWNISSAGPNFDRLIGRLFKTNILFNEYSHECFKY